MNVLKIGVLTFHRCINYGSYWQAKCLAEGLEALGHKVEILDHYSRRVNLAEWKCAFQPVLPTPVPSTDRSLYREKTEKFFTAFEKLPLSHSFPLDAPKEMPPYDLVVVGSDEVWNLQHPWYGQCPIFYGDGLKAQGLISYAASFGNYKVESGLEPSWAAKLSNFDSISVRDENSRALVYNATGVDPELVLDPCLQFPLALEDRHIPFGKGGYVAVYGHNFTPTFVKKVKDWAKEQRLPLVSIGYRNDWADEQWLTADPHDFAHFIANSENVVTNFFHGCVFALNNKKSFVCEITPYRKAKVTGLMQTLGGLRHLIAEDSPQETLTALLSQPLSVEVLDKIKQMRQHSQNYIAAALKVYDGSFVQP